MPRARRARAREVTGGWMRPERVWPWRTAHLPAKHVVLCMQLLDLPRQIEGDSRGRPAWGRASRVGRRGRCAGIRGKCCRSCGEDQRAFADARGRSIRRPCTGRPEAAGATSAVGAATTAGFHEPLHLLLQLNLPRRKRLHALGDGGHLLLEALERRCIARVGHRRRGCGGRRGLSRLLRLRLPRAHGKYVAEAGACRCRRGLRGDRRAASGFEPSRKSAAPRSKAFAQGLGVAPKLEKLGGEDLKAPKPQRPGVAHQGK